MAACVAVGALALPTLRVASILVGHFMLRPILVRRLRVAARGSLVLTYDDGPSRKLQVLLLAFLRSRGAKATFYLLESRSEGQRDLVEQLHRDGHEVATHSFGHLDAYRVPAGVACADLRLGLMVASRAQRNVRRFRPPRGRVLPATLLVAKRLGLAFDLWTVDSGDTFASVPDVEDIVRQVEDAGGGVVLLHSHDREDSRPDAEAHTLAVTEALLDLAERRGLRVCRMSDLEG